MPIGSLDCDWCKPTWKLSDLRLRVRRELETTPINVYYPNVSTGFEGPWWPGYPGSFFTHPSSFHLPMDPPLPGGMSPVVSVPGGVPQPPDLLQLADSEYLVDIHFKACLESLTCDKQNVYLPVVPPPLPELSLPDFYMPLSSWWALQVPGAGSPRPWADVAAPHQYQVVAGGGGGRHQPMNPIRFRGKIDENQEKVCCKPYYPQPTPSTGGQPGYALRTCCAAKRDLICQCYVNNNANRPTEEKTTVEECCITVDLPNALTIPGLTMPIFFDLPDDAEWPESWQPENWTVTWPSAPPGTFTTDPALGVPPAPAWPNIVNQLFHNEITETVNEMLGSLVLPAFRGLGVGPTGVAGLEILLAGQPITITIETQWGDIVVEMGPGQLQQTLGQSMENLLPGGHLQELNKPSTKTRIKDIINNELGKIAGRGIYGDSCTGGTLDNGDTFDPPSTGEPPTTGSIGYDWVAKCPCIPNPAHAPGFAPWPPVVCKER